MRGFCFARGMTMMPHDEAMLAFEARAAGRGRAGSIRRSQTREIIRIWKNGFEVSFDPPAGE
jgi:hypothetical protein